MKNDEFHDFQRQEKSFCEEFHENIAQSAFLSLFFMDLVNLCRKVYCKRTMRKTQQKRRKIMEMRFFFPFLKTEISNFLNSANHSCELNKISSDEDKI